MASYKEQWDHEHWRRAAYAVMYLPKWKKRILAKWRKRHKLNGYPHWPHKPDGELGVCMLSGQDYENIVEEFVKTGKLPDNLYPAPTVT